jgi:hypothetical protein
MRGGLALIVIPIASIVLALSGLLRLYEKKKYNEIFKIILLIIAYPLIFRMLSKINDKDARLYLAIPIVLIGMLWLILGFFVNGYSKEAGETETFISWLIKGMFYKNK